MDDLSNSYINILVTNSELTTFTNEFSQKFKEDSKEKYSQLGFEKLFIFYIKFLRLDIQCCKNFVESNLINTEKAHDEHAKKSEIEISKNEDGYLKLKSEFEKLKKKIN